MVNTYTSAEANKLLKKLIEEHAAILENERLTCMFDAAMGEDPDTLRPDYDFKATTDRLKTIEGKIRTVKHAISVFNSTHIVPGFDMTIDSMLVYIPQLSNRKNRLAGMKSKLPKARNNSRPIANIIDYTYTNYNVNDVAAEYEVISDELTRAQMALDKINTTDTMQIDI